MEEIYISTDVETDGPIPGAQSMLSERDDVRSGFSLDHGAVDGRRRGGVDERERRNRADDEDG